jgi:hypothetical protein
MDNQNLSQNWPIYNTFHVTGHGESSAASEGINPPEQCSEETSGQPLCGEDCRSKTNSLNHLWGEHQALYHWSQHLHWKLTTRTSELEQQLQASDEIRYRLDNAQNQLHTSEVEVGRLTAQLKRVEPLVVAYKKSKRPRSDSAE